MQPSADLGRLGRFSGELRDCRNDLPLLSQDKMHPLLEEVSQCQFCQETLFDLRSRTTYNTLKASARKGCAACACLLEATNYHRKKHPNVHTLHLNTFRDSDQPLTVSCDISDVITTPQGPLSYSPYKERQGQNEMRIDVFTVEGEIGTEEVIG